MARASLECRDRKLPLLGIPLALLYELFQMLLGPVLRAKSPAQAKLPNIEEL